MEKSSHSKQKPSWSRIKKWGGQQAVRKWKSRKAELAAEQTRSASVTICAVRFETTVLWALPCSLDLTQITWWGTLHRTVASPIVCFFPVFSFVGLLCLHFRNSDNCMKWTERELLSVSKCSSCWLGAQLPRESEAGWIRRAAGVGRACLWSFSTHDYSWKAHSLADNVGGSERWMVIIKEGFR